MRSRTSRSVKLRRQTRRRRIGTVVYRLLCIALVVGAGAFATTVFFKVKTIEISGVTRYSVEQIRQTLGAEEGDNLFFWGKRAGMQRLKREYPYIEAVSVRRQLPDTLYVDITQGEAFAALDNGTGSAFLISSGGKLLEETTWAEASDLPRIVGVAAMGREVGETLGASESETENALVHILSAMGAAGQIKNVDFINLTDAYAIRIGYLGRFDIRLGSTNELERKLQFLTKIINEKLSPSDIGAIELSNVSKVYFWPDTLENVQAASGITTPIPSEQEPADDTEGAQDTQGGDAPPALDP